VLHWNGREPGPAQELIDLKMVASVVAEFSLLVRVPEMLELLPKMPAEGQRCRACRGSPLMPTATAGTPDEYPGICPLCCGLAWTAAEPGAAPDS
jgi:hypothetical protein